MTTLPSIRSRLARSVLVVTLIWCIAVALVVGVVVQSAVDRLLDGALQESAEILFGLMEHHVDRTDPSDEILPAPPHEEGLIWQLVDTQGQMRMRSHRAPPEPLGAAKSDGFSNESARAPWRVYSMRLDSRQLILHVAQSREQRQAARLNAMAMASGTALLIGLLAAWWLRRRVTDETQHVVELSQTLRRYEWGQPNTLPSAQLPTVTREELLPIREAVMELTTRLAQRLANERAFSAHAAHALRTPLAGIDAQLAVALKESLPESKPRLIKARQATERLRRVVTALLSMFRAGTDPHPQAVDLASMLQQIPVDGLDVTLHSSGSVHADPDLLAAALLNILDNAVRYGATHMDVFLVCPGGDSNVEECCCADDSKILKFTDNGPGVSAERLQHLLGVLDRQDYSLIGLGLTLTDLVARAHGGRARVESTPGAGFTVLIQLKDAPSSKRPVDQA
ncbi:ATP-binding protein [Leptothrix ochracea]|uniref:sensor histidine kinase n=1 Tax=Leptothrix ochracea TaxID=735331 RepID=UPI0034E2A7A5